MLNMITWSYSSLQSLVPVCRSRSRSRQSTCERVKMTASLRNATNKLPMFPKPRLPEKWKGGRIEKLGNYILNEHVEYKWEPS